MFSIAYHLLWTASTALLVPYLLSRRSGGMRERLFAGGQRRPIRPGSIWVHALSVGEVLSAVPLVRRLREAHPGRDLVVTVSTTQGMAIAGKELDGVATDLRRMPLDLWIAMEKMIRQIRPGVFLLVETDIWPGLLDLLNRRGVPSLLVNGRISPRTFSAYRRFSPLGRYLFSLLDRCLMQTELDRRRLTDLGVPKDKVLVIGNIKFDRPHRPLSSDERSGWETILGLKPGDPVWVVGSTHEGEEEIILHVFQKATAGAPHLRLILAPRRIERAQHLVEAATRMGIETVLRSTLHAGSLPGRVIVLDTLGELDRIYGVADVSFVGGSFVPIGGHNLLEPAGFGVPVLFGPHMHNFAIMSEMLLEAGGGWRVQDGDALHRSLKRLLEDRGLRLRMGANARAFVEVNRGAVDRAMTHVTALMAGAGDLR